jgi:hypothetical protein
MFNNIREYFDYLRFSHTNRAYIGCVQVADISGIFVYTKMGDWQESAVKNIEYSNYRAISFVERGL